MKYIIPILISLLFVACSSNYDQQQQSYLNNNAAFKIGNIPFDFNSSKVVSSIIRPKDHQTILILSEKTSQSANTGMSNQNRFIPGTKWLLVYWQQKDDPVWIGARIPGKFLYTDIVQFNSDDFTINRYDSSGKQIQLDTNEKEKAEQFVLEVKPL